jgi:hypothetical protein
VAVVLPTDQEIRLWPNPSQDYIRIFNPSGALLRAWLLNLSGRKIQEYLFPPGSNQVDIHTWPSGTYLVVVRQGRENKYLKFFKL